MTNSSSRKSFRPGEFALIAALFAPLARAKGALGLLDDAALLSVARGKELVLTADAIVEGVHFLPGDPAESVAQKALRVNLSDLAAKAATPTGYLMTLALPDRFSYRWLKEFARGLARDQKRFAITLLGGDTTRTPGPLTIAITALGTAAAGRAILRKGARPGDVVFVSGTIGDAGAGLKLARRPARGADAKRLVGRYRVPEPRIALGTRLAGLAHAAIDISDGLIADLGHVADASRVHIEIDATRIPLSAAFRRVRGTSEAAILGAATSGDDYEIAFTCAPGARAKALAAAQTAGVRLTEIGRVVRGEGVTVLGARGMNLAIAKAGFTHF